MRAVSLEVGPHVGGMKVTYSFLIAATTAFVKGDDVTEEDDDMVEMLEIDLRNTLCAFITLRQLFPNMNSC